MRYYQSKRRAWAQKQQQEINVKLGQLNFWKRLYLRWCIAHSSRAALPNDADFVQNWRITRVEYPNHHSCTDTVTGSQNGYCYWCVLEDQGYSHNMSIAQQVDEIRKVGSEKRGGIIDPFTTWTCSLLEANELMGRYRISGVPVADHGKS